MVPSMSPVTPRMEVLTPSGVDGAGCNGGHWKHAAHRLSPTRRRNHYRLGTYRFRCVPPDRPPGGRFFNFCTDGPCPGGGSARTLHRDGRVGRWAGPLQGRTDGTDTDGTDTDSTDTDSTDKDTRDVSSYKVGVIGGDGIGPDVLAEALKVVDAAGVTLDTTEYELGAKRYIRTGEVLPDSVLEEISGQDAILLGAIGAAIGSTEVPPGTLERGLLLKLRFALDLYINLRLHRHPGEHRRHLRRRGRVPPQGHPLRGRHPRVGQHPPRRRALRPVRLRPGRDPRA